MDLRWFVLLLACSCGPTPYVSPYFSHHYTDQFPGPYHYDVVPNATTPKGIKVDTSGIDLDLTDTLAQIDTQVDAVEVCLGSTFSRPAVIGTYVSAQAQCDNTTFPLPLIRTDIIVKLAANYVSSCDGTQELLPVPAPDALCEAKGVVPTQSCPCRWRVGIELNKYIVVTPDLFLLKDSLIRLTTGCDNPWSPPLAPCARNP